MPRALSIHLGVNKPAGPHGDTPLGESERSAWRMAELAMQAGYREMQVLIGPAANPHAVHDSLTRAAGALRAGDTLFVSYSGHGTQVRDENQDERSRYDQGWCMADGLLVDDKLLGYWRLFEPGVRIVLVVESCHSGGSARDDEKDGARARTPEGDNYRDGGGYRDGGNRLKSGSGAHAGPGRSAWRSVAPAEGGGPCVVQPPSNPDGIRASLLMLAASTEYQTSRDGLFSAHLLKVWNGGDFEGSYCDLYLLVRDRVMNDHCTQQPQMMMLGAADPAFPLVRAFEPVPALGASTG